MSSATLPGDAEPLVIVSDVCKRYGPVRALDHVDFSIRPGEVRALLGKNGAGKSTLIRVISGAESFDSGQASVAGRPLAGLRPRDIGQLGVATVYQELSLVPGLTVADNLFLGQPWPRRLGLIDRAALNGKAAAALARLGVEAEPDALVRELSTAQQQLVEITRALQRDPALLILDEPTSSLAVGEVRLVLDVVRRAAEQGVAIIYVSHRMDEIRQIADRATVMRDGRVVGNVPVGSADNREIVSLMLGPTLAVAAQRPVPDAERATAAVDPKPVLAADRIVLRPKLNGVSLSLREGEILGLAGLLGSGRTELLQCLAGLRKLDGGAVLVDGVALGRLSHRRMLDLGIAMTPENRKAEGIFPLQGVDENLLLSDWRPVTTGGLVRASRVRAAAGDLAQTLGIKTAGVSSLISTLSGGNQQKAVIGRWLHAKSRILLLDEPTRGVDVEAKEQIYRLIRALAAQGAAVVFVSGELEELPGLCDRMLVLRDGAIAEELGRGTSVEELVAAALGESARRSG